MISVFFLPGERMDWKDICMGLRVDIYNTSQVTGRGCQPGSSDTSHQQVPEPNSASLLNTSLGGLNKAWNLFQTLVFFSPHCMVTSKPYQLSLHFQSTWFPLMDRRGASKVTQCKRICQPMQETWVRSLCWEDPLGKEMATHSSILAWRIPWTEEPGGL